MCLKLELHTGINIPIYLTHAVTARSKNLGLIFYPSRNPDPGVKKALDPGSGSATLPKSKTHTILYILIVDIDVPVNVLISQ
jgi:hypothetical protein